MKVFLSHPENYHYIRELTRLTGEKLNSVRRELGNLEEWGIVRSEDSSSVKSGKTKTRIRKTRDKKYFQANTGFVLFNELKGLVMKSWLLVEKSLVQKITRLGKIRLLILSGRFSGNPEVETDVLIVGSINRDKLKKLIKNLARSFGEDINYTIMTNKEFKYRKEITDKFLYKILETGHVKVIDKT